MIVEFQAAQLAQSLVFLALLIGLICFCCVWKKNQSENAKNRLVDIRLNEYILRNTATKILVGKIDSFGLFYI